MRTFGWIGLCILAIGLIWVLSFTCGMCSDATKVVKREFSASALLKKYEDFKRLSAAIDAKRAMIDLYQEELTSYCDSLGKLTATDRDTRTYFEQRKSELIGIIAMHNSLCENYNTRMAEFNYKFTNIGDLPASNLEPLPREYKPYILSLKNTKK